MNCVNHETRNGVNTCSKCGHWLCEDCSIDIDGRVVCKRCVAELLSANANQNPESVKEFMKRHEHRTGRAEHSAERRYERSEYSPEFREPPRRYEHAPERRELPRRYEYAEGYSTGGRRKISRFWLLIFSCVPGVNYMFMGLIKRGLYALSAFMLAVYCGATLNSPLLALVAGVIYIVSVFDGFKVRRMLINGEYVEDGFSGITNMIYRHKIPVFIVAVLLVASNMFSRSYYSMYHYMYSDDFKSIFMLVLIAAVIYFFVKPACKSKKRTDSEYIDKREQ